MQGGQDVQVANKDWIRRTRVGDIVKQVQRDAGKFDERRPEGVVEPEINRD